MDDARGRNSCHVCRSSDLTDAPPERWAQPLYGRKRLVCLRCEAAVLVTHLLVYVSGDVAQLQASPSLRSRVLGFASPVKWSVLGRAGEEPPPTNRVKIMPFVTRSILVIERKFLELKLLNPDAPLERVGRLYVTSGPLLAL